MALFEKAFEGMLEGRAVTGLAVGAGVLLLAPGLLPIIGRALRPIAVGVIKTGMTLYNQTASTIRETAEDVMAEARSGLEADRSQINAEASGRRTRGETQAT